MGRQRLTRSFAALFAPAVLCIIAGAVAQLALGDSWGAGLLVLVGAFGLGLAIDDWLKARRPGDRP